jgi:two-component system sensor histidine kinase YesM
MTIKYRTFINTMLIIILSLLIITLMYTITINTSLNTINHEIEVNNINRLKLIINTLDYNVENLDLLSTAINSDSKIELLKAVNLMSNYEQTQLNLDISEKLNLQRFTHGWENQITIYSNLLEKWIGPSASLHPPPPGQINRVWSLNQLTNSFELFRNYEYYSVKIEFPKDNLVQMLDSVKTDTNNPFFYDSGTMIITPKNTDATLANEMRQLLQTLIANKAEGNELITINDISYLVSFLRSEELDWYMVDYVPINDAIAPILKTKEYFYITCVMLFLTGLIILLYIYRKVQIPILTLITAVRQIKNENFSYRINKVSNNEFDAIYHNFNAMAQDIEELIEKVYRERIFSREALIKQLQSQINPHFLYNCLFFINNMNRLGNDEAVSVMTQNLAEYFRYTTRVDEPLTTLKKEIEVVKNYLNIHCLRMDRIHYHINISEGMLDLNIPKLTIQPLVENSIIHGIESKKDSGLIEINGYEDEDAYYISIEDDGKGISQEHIDEIHKKIDCSNNDSSGYALWNIKQRLTIHFSQDSTLIISSREPNGTKVTVKWLKQ